MCLVTVNHHLNPGNKRKVMLRVWFMNHPEQAVNTTYNMEVCPEKCHQEDQDDQVPVRLVHVKASLQLVLRLCKFLRKYWCIRLFGLDLFMYF